jgi:5'-nucleotidase
LRHIVELPDFPRSTLLNINLPPLPGDQIKGVRLTTLGRRIYSDSLMKMKDPWGREIFWIGGGSAQWSGREDSDFLAIREGYVSITPLHLDLTNYALLEAAQSWWREP